MAEEGQGWTFWHVSSEAHMGQVICLQNVTSLLSSYKVAITILSFFSWGNRLREVHHLAQVYLFTHQ